jgi:hypothetical protein
MKGRLTLIDSPYAEGDIKNYLEHLSRKDKYLAMRLKAMGLPSEGDFRLTSTPANKHDPAYKAYKKFAVKTFAVLVGNLDEIDFDNLPGQLHISVSGQLSPVWRVWLLDITRDDMNAYIRYMWNGHTNGAVVTIENINSDLQSSLISNGQGHAARSVIEQLKHLLPGLKILEIEETKRGRRRGSGWFRTKPLCTESAEVFLGLKVPLLKYDVVILAIASISMVF